MNINLNNKIDKAHVSISSNVAKTLEIYKEHLTQTKSIMRSLLLLDRQQYNQCLASICDIELINNNRGYMFYQEKNIDAVIYDWQDAIISRATLESLVGKFKSKELAIVTPAHLIDTNKDSLFIKDKEFIFIRFPQKIIDLHNTGLWQTKTQELAKDLGIVLDDLAEIPPNVLSTDYEIIR